MNKKIKKEDPSKVEGWMATFADMVTLLMAFFVLLYAMSDPDPGKADAAFEEVAQAMKETFGEKQISEFQKLSDSLNIVMDNQNISDKVNIELTPEGIEIKMEGNSLFDDCSADLRSDIEPIIASISNSITSLLDKESSKYKGYIIEVKGHTDNLPPTNCKYFDTNWNLSAYRATGVVEHLLASGIKKNKIKAIAMGDSDPLFPNTDSNGYSIPENQAKNRRVEIFINKFD